MICLRDVLKLFAHSITVKNIMSIVGATLAAQLIGIFALPIASRLYSPADFGVLALYTSVVSILTMFTGLRYYLAIPLPKQNRYAVALLYTTLLAHFVFVAFVFVIAITVGRNLLDLLKLSTMKGYIYWIPVGVFATGLYTIITQWAVREGYFNTIGWTRINQAILGNATKIALGFFGYKPVGLILGAIIAQGAGSSTILKRTMRERVLVKVSLADIRRVILRYRTFPIYDMWTAAINVLGYNMPQLFLSYYFSLSSVGLYTMASSLLSMPISLIGSALGQVFIQKMAQAKYNGTLTSLCQRSYKAMLLLSMYPIGLISILGPMIFTFFLGKQWVDSGFYAVVLFPRIAYSMTYSPICMVYAVTDNIKMSFYHEVFLTVGMFVGLYLGLLADGNAVWVIGSYSTVSLVIMIYRMIYILHVAGIKKSDSLRTTLSIFTITAILLLIPGIAIILNLSILHIILASCISFVLFFSIVYANLKSLAC